MQVIAAEAKHRATPPGCEHAVRVYQAYVAEMPRLCAMRPIPAELVATVDEITNLLRGRQAVETSRWGPRIQEALAAVALRRSRDWPGLQRAGIGVSVGPP